MTFLANLQALCIAPFFDTNHQISDSDVQLEDFYPVGLYRRTILVTTQCLIAI
jgi:hypothetical protein